APYWARSSTVALPTGVSPSVGKDSAQSAAAGTAAGPAAERAGEDGAPQENRAARPRHIEADTSGRAVRRLRRRISKPSSLKCGMTTVCAIQLQFMRISERRRSAGCRVISRKGLSVRKRDPFGSVRRFGEETSRRRGFSGGLSDTVCCDGLLEFLRACFLWEQLAEERSPLKTRISEQPQLLRLPLAAAGLPIHCVRQLPQ